MRTVLLSAALAIAFGASTAVTAQSFPAKPVTIVVPFSAGGPTDTLARILGERLRTALGQTILIDNTTGAGGTIGTGRVVRAAPDGYMLSIGHWGTHVVNGAY
jgi:tripartite-type tricarboxylate transporter receptor subunit TctC